MSKKRMLSNIIVSNDVFLDMPLSSQALYFHLNMNADDYGFVSPKRVMRMIGANDDDLKILIAKRYVLWFDSGVVVVKHWEINNTVRKDRSTMTSYMAEYATLTQNEFGAYTELSKIQALFEVDNVANTTEILQLTEIDEPTSGKSQPLVGKMATQIRLDEIRLDKTSVDTNVSTSAVALRPPKQKPVPTKEIDELFVKWEQTIGYAVTANVKSNREYAAKLIRENAPDDIEKMLRGVALSHADQYAPRVSNFVQLYRKWDDLKAWGRRQQQSMNASRGRNTKL